MAEENGQPRRFVLKQKQVEVILQKDGVDKLHTIREMVGHEREKYLNTAQPKIIFGSDGRYQRHKDYQGLYSDMLGLCLYDDQGNLVPAQMIARWPTSILEQLVEIANEVNGFDAKAQEKAKNESQESGLPGSA